jgi:hypothetical protein
MWNMKNERKSVCPFYGEGLEAEMMEEAFGEEAYCLAIAVKRPRGADPVAWGSQVGLRAINWVDSNRIPSDT